MLALAIIIFVFVSSNCVAAEPTPADPGEDSQFAFATQLMEEGDYFRAITELKRFLHLYPKKSPRAEEAEILIPESYLRAGRSVEAAEGFKAFLDRRPDSPLAEQAMYGRAMALINSGERTEGRRLLEELSKREPEGRYRPSAVLEVAFSLAEEGEWGKARGSVERLWPRGHEAEQRERLMGVLKAGESRRRSPAVAGLLSGLIPGAGQLYCGRPRDAGLAMLINGLFIWGAVEAGTRGNYPLAAGLSLIEFAWYGGTVYGAVNCAHKHELDSAREAREEFLGTAREGSLENLQFALHYAF